MKTIFKTKARFRDNYDQTDFR